MKIALVGYARSGKDTVGWMMKKHLEHAKLVSFGSELRDRFHTAFPEVPKEPKPRDLYEKFGKLGRAIDPDLWIDYTENSIRLWEFFGYTDFILTDLRQKNEEEWARKNGFILVEVFATDEDRKFRSLNDAEFQLVNNSEKYLDRIKCDHLIFNVGDRDHLKEQVLSVINAIQGESKK